MPTPLFPFSNDYFEEVSEQELQKHFEAKKDLAGIMMEYFGQNENEKIVAPDTAGVDYYFLEDFLTANMEIDFALIEQDFLKNCKDRLHEFNEVCTFSSLSFRTRKPSYSTHKKIVALIYSGAKLGDSYCVELIKYLYKTYHKPEYSKLKKFRKISTAEIFGLSEDERGGCDYSAMGRILGMCPFMYIEYNNDCSILFKLLLKRRDDWIRYDEELCEYQTVDSDLYAECKTQIDVWFDEEEKAGAHYDRVHEAFYDINDFTSTCLRGRGFSEDYLYHCIDLVFELKHQMTRTLALLKTEYPNKEFTFEQVQKLTNIHNLVEGLADVSDSYETEISYLLGEEVDPLDYEYAQFNPNDITSQNTSKKEVKKAMTTVAPVSNGAIGEEDYINEIAELRAKLHEKEQENMYLRDQYRSAKRSSDEANSLLKKYEEERDELISLREFAYNLEHEEDAPVEEDTLSEMKKLIAEKKIVIIGGHINWQNKLKELFPNWKFISVNAYKTVDGAMLENKDKVYFYTDYISHVSYYKFIAAVRERKIPFGYIGTYNIDKAVRQIYQDSIK